MAQTLGRTPQSFVRTLLPRPQMSRAWGMIHWWTGTSCACSFECTEYSWVLLGRGSTRPCYPALRGLHSFFFLDLWFLDLCSSRRISPPLGFLQSHVSLVPTASFSFGKLLLPTSGYVASQVDFPFRLLTWTQKLAWAIRAQWLPQEWVWQVTEKSTLEIAGTGKKYSFFRVAQLGREAWHCLGPKFASHTWKAYLWIKPSKKKESWGMEMGVLLALF